MNDLNGHERQLQSGKLPGALAYTLLFALLVMSIFEITKQLIAPDINIWESHIVTILFSSTLATIAAFFIFRSQERLQQQLVKDIAAREQVEAALRRSQEELETRVAERTAELVEANTATLQITRLAEQNQRAVLLTERNRMAREIHDTLAQGFTGIVIQLEATEDVLQQVPQDIEAALAHLSRARTLARDNLAEARRSVWALRPSALEQETLPTALSHLLKQLTADTSLHAELTVHGLPQVLPREVEADLLRISQEAVSNALKHAEAHAIQMTLNFDPQYIQLRIEDDGRGFDPCTLTPQGFGLTSMRERTEHGGGAFALTSQPGHGTTIQVTLPLPQRSVMKTLQ